MGIVKGVEIRNESNDPIGILDFKANTEVKIAKCTLVIVGNPAYTSIQLEAYNMISATDKELHQTSLPVLKEDIVSQGWSNIPFVFNPTFTALQKNRFGFKLKINGYTFESNNHIGWLVNSTPLYSDRKDISIEIIGVQL